MANLLGPEAPATHRRPPRRDWALPLSLGLFALASSFLWAADDPYRGTVRLLAGLFLAVAAFLALRDARR